MIPVPSHLAGLPVLDTGVSLAIRSTEYSSSVYHPIMSVDKLWEVLTDEQRRDLLQISLMLTDNYRNSPMVACRQGAFVLYADNEIRVKKHLLDLARYNVL